MDGVLTWTGGTSRVVPRRPAPAENAPDWPETAARCCFRISQARLRLRQVLPLGRPLTSITAKDRGSRLSKTVQRVLFRIECLDNGREFRQCQQFSNPFGDVTQFERTTRTRCDRGSIHNVAESLGIDVRHVK